MLIRILVLFLCFQVFYKIYDRYWRSTLRITYFDIGQGDAILLEFPYGKTMLMDSGGGIEDFSYGKRDLFLELAAKGILNLDAVVLSHPDRDHGYGFLGLSEHVIYKELWINSLFQREPRPLTQSLLGIAELQKTKIHSFSRAESLHWGEVTLNVIPLQTQEGGDNNRCLVLFLDYGSCRFLFTGDIEFPGEAELSHFDKERIHVLKVAHHGSKGSTADKWLEIYQPQLAVVSAGLNNSYGHPHYPLLSRIKKRQIPLLRTDFHGYIEMAVTKDGHLTCRNAFGSCGSLTCR